MSAHLEVFFLDAGGSQRGQRFCVLHRPIGEVRGAVLYVHPFAEEMNKTRRMAALQSRALAQCGFVVLQVDLHGCGDSSGEFSDATWEGWVDDVRHASRWLGARYAVPQWIWGLRAGCLLATQAVAGLGSPRHLLFWQPTTSGRNVLHQFLRIGTGLTGGSSVRVKVDDLRQRLLAGSTVAIAGYTLAPCLASGLESARLDPPNETAPGTRLVWIETSSSSSTELLPASVTCLEKWLQRNLVEARVVDGPPFWQSAEIEEAPALIAATCEALERGGST